MGKIDSSYQARLDGMAFALRVAEKDGIEGLRKELKFRNAHFVPLEITAEGDLLLDYSPGCTDSPHHGAGHASGRRWLGREEVKKI